MRKVLIIDARNVIRNGGESVISRHVEYSKLLKRESENRIELNILDSYAIYEPEMIFRESHRHKLKKKNTLRFFLHLVSVLRKDKSIALLVSGDPWVPSIISIIARFMSNVGIPLQIQIHGDIGNKHWKTTSPINFLKYIVARISLKYANNIRTVGRQQSLNLVNAFGINANKITEIPVRLSFYPDIRVVNSFQHNLPNIGFVGRIQKERNYKKLIWILEILAREDHLFSLQIIGDGPGLNKLQETIKTIFPKIKVVYSGWLDGRNLEKEFSKIDILISTAEFESYGRTIREAEMLGIPVLAIRSSGVTDAATESKTNLIQIIEPTDPPEVVLQKYNTIIKNMEIRAEINQKEITHPKELTITSGEVVRLWLSLC